MKRNVGAEAKAMPINLGIEEKDRQEIAQGLSRLLADTYTLYLKTHNFHWNVTGQMFQTLHLIFEQQYNELALAVDQIAERIRALGFFAPGSYREFSQLSSIKEEEAIPEAREMVRLMVEGQEKVIRTTLDTTLMAYSMTKTFTAVAVLQLVEQGKLELDGEIDLYLPDTPYDGRHIAISQLLDHTSGIPNPIPSAGRIWRKRTRVLTKPRRLPGFCATTPNSRLSRARSSPTPISAIGSSAKSSSRHQGNRTRIT